MSRFGQIQGYVAFVDGLGIGVSMGILRVDVTALRDVANVCASHGLDFDDAYQYTVAEQNGIQLISFDSDFDRTPRGRLTPAAALQHFKSQP
jgi:predicted nucleic acid-binding protein